MDIDQILGDELPTPPEQQARDEVVAHVRAMLANAQHALWLAKRRSGQPDPILAHLVDAWAEALERIVPDTEADHYHEWRP